jgi:SAM-dependent methyltransferase
MVTDVHIAAHRGFSEAAASYTRGRPQYPGEIRDWLRDQIGLGPGKLVIEIGAGTGKFTQSLVRTGAQVVAVEPVPAMRAHLSANAPEARVISGSAESIEMNDSTADAVVCAQSFHWFATYRALTEIHRVLKPGGALGLVWNVPDERVSWVAALDQVIRPHETASPVCFRSGAWQQVFPDQRFTALEVAHYAHLHTGSPQRVIVERARSLSFVATLAPEAQSAVVGKLKRLIATLPELRGRRTIEFPYRTLAYHCLKRESP